MSVETTEEFIDRLQRMSWDAGWPWERWLINQERRKDGKAPFR